jgi:hypothetical protein
VVERADRDTEDLNELAKDSATQRFIQASSVAYFFQGNAWDCNDHGASMLKVYSCIATQHDLRLVLLAAFVCLLASFTAINLLHHAGNSVKSTRRMWLAVAAVATGFGIWATHFIAMLAFQPAIPSGYNILC